MGREVGTMNQRANESTGLGKNKVKRFAARGEKRYAGPKAAIPFRAHVASLGSFRACLIAVKSSSVKISQSAFFNSRARTRKNKNLRQIPSESN